METIPTIKCPWCETELDDLPDLYEEDIIHCPSCGEEWNKNITIERQRIVARIENWKKKVKRLSEEQEEATLKMRREVAEAVREEGTFWKVAMAATAAECRSIDLQTGLVEEFIEELEEMEDKHRSLTSSELKLIERIKERTKEFCDEDDSGAIFLEKNDIPNALLVLLKNIRIAITPPLVQEIKAMYSAYTEHDFEAIRNIWENK
jgi:metal-sulfur cluster biosynthetic enzyme